LDSLKAKGELLIYETSYASLNEFMTRKRAEEIRGEFLKRGIKVREITNTPYHEEYTNVKGYHEKVMNIRYINLEKLGIEKETLIYNDVVAFYSLTNEIYGIEIYNKDFAEMQRRVFNYIWKLGEKPIIGKNGRTSMF